MDPVDLLCIAAHTDDAEIALGGTLRLLAAAGRSVWVCDLTRGELASNAAPDERWAEAAQASQQLGLTGRLQLALPDGFVSAENSEQVAAVTAVVRWLHPRWIFCAPEPRRHPDHVQTPTLVSKAVFMANLITYDPGVPQIRGWPQEAPALDTSGRWHVEALFTICPLGKEPSLVFDCSETWPAKLAALECYRSQFQRDPGRQRTILNHPALGEEIERRARHWGYLSGCQYAEALRTPSAPLCRDLPEDTWV